VHIVLHSRPAPASPDPVDRRRHESRAGPILVIDSGLGGLTVAAALREALPAQDLVYVGDTARVPYGAKSPDAIRLAVVELFHASIARLAAERIRPGHLVVACNSASAVALDDLRSLADIEGFGVTGVIGAGVRAICAAGGKRAKPTLAVIGTSATIHSRAYDAAILRRRPRSHVILRATPLLVPIVEEGRREDDPLIDLALRQYLLPVLRRAEALSGQLDALLLGCTHYPMLESAIRRVVGEGPAIIDSAVAVATEVQRKLHHGQPDDGEVGPGALRLMTTDVPARFGRLASGFLGCDCGEPELLRVDDLSIPGPATQSAPARIGRLSPQERQAQRMIA